MLFINSPILFTIMFPLFLLKYFVNNNKAFIVGIVSSAIQIKHFIYKFNFIQTEKGLDTGIRLQLYNFDSVTFNFNEIK